MHMEGGCTTIWPNHIMLKTLPMLRLCCLSPLHCATDALTRHDHRPPAPAGDPHTPAPRRILRRTETQERRTSTQYVLR